MQSAKIAPADVQDPYERQTPGLGLGRDPERTPMQWADEAYGGFSTVDPWLQVNDDLATVNVATQAKDDNSSLSMYRALLELRRSAALRSGVYVEWPGSNENVFGYSRQSEYETLLILLNMSDETVTCRDNVKGEVIYSTDVSVESIIGEGIVLNPYQGVVIRRQD
jgi:alpha-glucosidase